MLGFLLHLQDLFLSHGIQLACDSRLFLLKPLIKADARNSLLFLLDRHTYLYVFPESEHVTILELHRLPFLETNLVQSCPVGASHIHECPAMAFPFDDRVFLGDGWILDLIATCPSSPDCHTLQLRTDEALTFKRPSLHIQSQWKLSHS